MQAEIERKYFVDLKKLPFDLDTLPSREIEQCYLLWNEAGEEARIRKIAEQFKLTYKRGEGLERMETEIDITAEQYNSLYPLTAGRRLRKTRYYVNHENLMIEIDVYKGKAAGLVIAEIEFPSAEDYTTFTPPGWFGEEMTQVESLRNRNLAVE